MNRDAYNMLCLFIYKDNSMKKLLATLLVACSTIAFATSSQQNYHTDIHTYKLTKSFNLSVPKGSKGETNLWVPLPFNSEYQEVKLIQFEGNYKNAYITENNQYGAKTLFANWAEHVNKRALKIKLVIQTKDREPMA